jgi:hypothetical protein
MQIRVLASTSPRISPSTLHAGATSSPPLFGRQLDEHNDRMLESPDQSCRAGLVMLQIEPFDQVNHEIGRVFSSFFDEKHLF